MIGPSILLFTMVKLVVHYHTSFAKTVGTINLMYGQPRDEIAAQAAHGTPRFQVDNAKVFEMLNNAIGTHKNVKK
jgi:hypothetical protein